MHAILMTIVAVFVILDIARIVLNAFFLYYTYHLQKSGCSCAMNWRRTFMEVSLFIFVLLGLLRLFGMRRNVWVDMFDAILFVTYVVITRQFLLMMKRSQCYCARNKTFKWLDIINYLQIVMLCLLLLIHVIKAGVHQSIKDSAAGTIRREGASSDARSILAKRAAKRTAKRIAAASRRSR